MSAVSAALIRCFSVPRFDGYLDAVAGDQEAAVALYLWNTEATGAMWETVGHLEIALRNVLADRLTERHARAGRMGSWLNDPARELAEKARTDIAKARSRVAAKNKSASDGQTVSELSFGFWRFFFARRYNTTLRPDLAGAFPHAPIATAAPSSSPSSGSTASETGSPTMSGSGPSRFAPGTPTCSPCWATSIPTYPCGSTRPAGYRRCSPRARLSARSRSCCDVVETGRRVWPPEDCGGPWGFTGLMDALGDEKHPQHEMYRDWMPVGYDPARFDLVEINEALAKLDADALQP